MMLCVSIDILVQYLHMLAAVHIVRASLKFENVPSEGYLNCSDEALHIVTGVWMKGGRVQAFNFHRNGDSCKIFEQKTSVCSTVVRTLHLSLVWNDPTIDETTLALISATVTYRLLYRIFKTSIYGFLLRSKYWTMKAHCHDLKRSSCIKLTTLALMTGSRAQGSAGMAVSCHHIGVIGNKEH